MGGVKIEFPSVHKRRIASRCSNNDFPPQLSDDNVNDVYDNACAEQRWRRTRINAFRAGETHARQAKQGNYIT